MRRFKFQMRVSAGRRRRRRMLYAHPARAQFCRCPVYLLANTSVYTLGPRAGFARLTTRRRCFSPSIRLAGVYRRARASFADRSAICGCSFGHYAQEYRPSVTMATTTRPARPNQIEGTHLTRRKRTDSAPTNAFLGSHILRCYFTLIDVEIMRQRFETDAPLSPFFFFFFF